MGQSIAQLHRRSLSERESFWGEAAESLVWRRRWDKVLDDSRPPLTRWFSGGVMNTCENALDRHVESGAGDRPAIKYDSPVTQTQRIITYDELHRLTARFAGVLRQYGVGAGDRVVISMPMVPEAIIAMLACARIGAVHAVVFGGFAAKELAKRISDAEPKVIVSASCGIEPSRIVPYKPLLDTAIELASCQPQTCVILQRPELAAPMIPGRDVDWHEAMESAAPAECVPVPATHPLYILYTSGSTGIPKGVVRDHGGHAVALNWSMRHIYDAAPGETYWAASDVGWVVGHSYIVYGPLLHGCTTVLYEGKPIGTPDAGAFWRVCEEHQVRTLFTAPTAFRAIRREDPQGELIRRYDLSCLRALFLAGERTDPDTLRWAQEQFRIPVVDHWWQTETGWAITANCLGVEPLPVKPGSATVPVPGYDLQVLDDAAAPLEAGRQGNIALKLPLPPGSLLTLWNNDEGYRSQYLETFPGYYATGDMGFVDEDGYVWIMGRTDDIINVAGHRLSTGGIEQAILAHPDVAECAVIGAADQLKGEAPLGLLVLCAGVDRPAEQVISEVISAVRETIGPVASFKRAVIVKRLPKTRSGKILRGTMKRIADGVDFQIPSTIDDPTILDEIAAALAPRGDGQSQCLPRS